MAVSKIINNSMQPNLVMLSVKDLIPEPHNWKINFTKKQKRLLRPIAETLAMLDGEPFFGLSRDEKGNDTWYEKYLPMAWELFNNSGGKKGWAGALSWIKEDPTVHENAVVKEAYDQWKMVKALSRKI